MSSKKHQQYVISKRARKLMGERVSEALQAKRERGERIGCLPPYGYEYRGNRMIEHKGEQMIIQRIVQLRKDGLSLRGICRELTTQGIPSRSGIWHASVVRGILRGVGIK